MRKTIEDWQNIFQHQKLSGLPIRAYCQQQNINPSTFYKHKQLSAQPKKFIKAQIVQRVSNTSVNKQLANGQITLETPAGKLTFAETIAPTLIIELVRGLS